MAKPSRANRRELHVRPVEGGNPTVDIFFDEHRVWSTKLPDPPGGAAYAGSRGPMRSSPTCTAAPRSRCAARPPARSIAPAR